jgi:hypothetical protein
MTPPGERRIGNARRFGTLCIIIMDIPLERTGRFADAYETTAAGFLPENEGLCISFRIPPQMPLSTMIFAMDRILALNQGYAHGISPRIWAASQ